MSQFDKKPTLENKETRAMRVEILDAPEGEALETIARVLDIIKKNAELKLGREPLTLMINGLNGEDVAALKRHGFTVRVYEW